MVTIKACKMNIGLELFTLSDFTSVSKYIVDEEPEYFMISKSPKELEKPEGKPVQVTEFFEIYEFDGKKLQLQKNNGTYSGAILYDGNTVYLYPAYKGIEIEYLLSQYAFVYFLAKKGGILFHGSSFIYQDKGILLSAKSGTGKSTHSRLWQKYENITVINDDKNVLMLENGRLILYGAPWSGKHMLDNNVTHSLDAICFLYQNPTNEIKRLRPIEAMRKILGQIDMPTEENQELWNTITDKLLSLPVYYLGCNMDKEAYLTLKERLDNDICQ